MTLLSFANLHLHPHHSCLQLVQPTVHARVSFPLLSPPLLYCLSITSHVGRHFCTMAATLVFLDTCTTTSSWDSVDQHTQQLHSWPAALLPAKAIVLPCQLGAAQLRSSKQRGSSVAGALVRALQDLHNPPQQLVLVGHGFGGHLLKVCVSVTVTKPMHTLSLLAESSTHIRILPCTGGVPAAAAACRQHSRSSLSAPAACLHPGRYTGPGVLLHPPPAPAAAGTARVRVCAARHGRCLPEIQNIGRPEWLADVGRGGGCAGGCC